MNVFNKRFNRTVQEDFVDYGEEALEDLRPLSYLDHYNRQQPHRSLNNLTPLPDARPIPARFVSNVVASNSFMQFASSL